MRKTIDNAQNKFRAKLEKFEGTDVVFNGNNPWDIRVYNSNLYERMLAQGSLGLGEAYMDGWWDCEQLDELFNKICSTEFVAQGKCSQTLMNKLWAYCLNRQSKHFVSPIVKQHYDMGNDLYRAMLESRMTYSCGYWKTARTLEQAQAHKFELICRKLNVQAGQKILDIGCGGGSFMKYAAENYGVSCVGITLAEKQLALAKELCADLPIDIRLADYRELDERFDHIVSIGMFEHVGYKNYSKYMQVVRNCLKDNGLFLLHTIGGNTSVITTDAWIDKYIFPDGMLPSLKQIAKAPEGKFVMEDWHNFGADYDRTLMCWFENFSRNWGTLIKTNRYDERFFRMWKYYLLSCAGAFRSRVNQLWQIVLSTKGVPGGYVSVR
ncbi:Cyclopropane-fatty-acyl-phospholipid synthase [Candidatus Methylobacter favarea]|uniref:Cyclopropane-fatty-acyl-phospholipid synthase n=1 Tax=Candidatus Methylobacter favarea TaxID=2707345 RepID=A0A8S0XH38_9GAMM|nr:cyclopropane fatty acyl phospholipid synthase [Candidatus Methylobacter favarea]CAA9891531.1 Cyclopropane-fatty-acyl-phospholipid synthase [Candidatus Methylobacter favarea]